MSEDYLIRNCAPTLARIKTGSMFTCPFESRDAMQDSIRKLNRQLCPKGLRLIPLRFSDKKVLIYLYRPAKLQTDLTHSVAAQLLRSHGYDPDNCEKCVVRLAKKLRARDAFPHEIGLFLGYPPEDVCGFIEQGPDRCKCCGCWKVYGDESAAKLKFAQYKKCTRIYCEQWAKGKNMDRLTVAG